MDERTKEHLFDRYYRGQKTLEKEIKGSGLGTAIAKQLIELHEGKISVESKPEVGTEIILTFPIKS